MDSTSFELTLSLPHDTRFTRTIRDLAIHAAQYAGCGRDQAEAFGAAAEELLREHLADATFDGQVPIIVRRAAGPLEVVIHERTVRLEI